MFTFTCIYPLSIDFSWYRNAGVKWATCKCVYISGWLAASKQCFDSIDNMPTLLFSLETLHEDNSCLLKHEKWELSLTDIVHWPIRRPLSFRNTYQPECLYPPCLTTVNVLHINRSVSMFTLIDRKDYESREGCQAGYPLYFTKDIYSLKKKIPPWTPTGLFSIRRISNIARHTILMWTSDLSMRVVPYHTGNCHGKPWMYVICYMLMHGQPITKGHSEVVCISQ